MKETDAEVAYKPRWLTGGGWALCGVRRRNADTELNSSTSPRTRANSDRPRTARPEATRVGSRSVNAAPSRCDFTMLFICTLAAQATLYRPITEDYGPSSQSDASGAGLCSFKQAELRFPRRCTEHTCTQALITPSISYMMVQKKTPA